MKRLNFKVFKNCAIHLLKQALTILECNLSCKIVFKLLKLIEIVISLNILDEKNHSVQVCVLQICSKLFWNATGDIETTVSYKVTDASATLPGFLKYLTIITIVEHKYIRASCKVI